MANSRTERLHVLLPLSISLAVSSMYFYSAVVAIRQVPNEMNGTLD